MVDKKKIRARMIELGLKNKDIARAWHCAISTVSQKLNGVRPISLTEANILAELLSLSELEYYTFLFAPKIA